MALHRAYAVWGTLVIGSGLALACGGPGANGDATGDAGGEGSASGGAGSATGGSGSGGTGEVADLFELTVQVVWAPLRNPGTKGNISARGITHPIPGTPQPEPIDYPEPVCTEVEVGGCRSTRCEKLDPADLPDIPPDTTDYSGSYAADDAGKIDLSLSFPGGDGPITGSIEPDQYGSYAQVSLVGQLGGGETGTLTAAGGELPPFTASVKMPLLLIATAPAIAGDGSISASAKGALQLTWDRGEAGTELWIQTRTGDSNPTDTTHSYTLSCHFDSSLGAGTIDASVMKNLSPGYEADLFTVSSVDLSKEGHKMRYLAVTEVTEATKKLGVYLKVTE